MFVRNCCTWSKSAKRSFSSILGAAVFSCLQKHWDFCSISPSAYWEKKYRPPLPTLLRWHNIDFNAISGQLFMFWVMPTSHKLVYVIAMSESYHFKEGIIQSIKLFIKKAMTHLNAIWRRTDKFVYVVCVCVWGGGEIMEKTQNVSKGDFRDFNFYVIQKTASFCCSWKKQQKTWIDWKIGKLFYKPVLLKPLRGKIERPLKNWIISANHFD